MTRERWLAVLLIVIGLGVVLIAPRAQSCMTDFDATVCEATGTVVLNVIGVTLVAVAAAVLALRGTPTD
jgi:drug/metabolite transporter (DMT)-like permease